MWGKKKTCQMRATTLQTKICTAFANIKLTENPTHGLEAGSSCKMHITLTFTLFPKLLWILWCATLLLEHVIVWRRRPHFFILSQHDSGGGVEFAPRSVFGKRLWSNQVPRRCRTELIAGKVFLTFASNHSSLLIFFYNFFLFAAPHPSLTNLFHQLSSRFNFLSQHVSSLILSRRCNSFVWFPALFVSVRSCDIIKKSSRYQENVFVLEWHQVA